MHTHTQRSGDRGGGGSDERASAHNRAPSPDEAGLVRTCGDVLMLSNPVKHGQRRTNHHCELANLPIRASALIAEIMAGLLPGLGGRGVAMLLCPLAPAAMLYAPHRAPPTQTTHVARPMAETKSQGKLPSNMKSLSLIPLVQSVGPLGGA